MFQTIKYAFGEKALGRSAVFKLYKCFEKGRERDSEHTVRQRTVRAELKSPEGASLACVNRFKTAYEVSAKAEISHGIWHKILCDDLNMSHVTQHSVANILTQN
jgi:regulator of RNase E activity RraB